MPRAKNTHTHFRDLHTWIDIGSEECLNASHFSLAMLFRKVGWTAEKGFFLGTRQDISRDSYRQQLLQLFVACQHRVPQQPRLAPFAYDMLAAIEKKRHLENDYFKAGLNVYALAAALAGMHNRSFYTGQEVGAKLFRWWTKADLGTLPLSQRPSAIINTLFGPTCLALMPQENPVLLEAAILRTRPPFAEAIPFTPPPAPRLAEQITLPPLA